jgi:hypothetical protein
VNKLANLVATVFGRYFAGRKDKPAAQVAAKWVTQTDTKSVAVVNLPAA